MFRVAEKAGIRRLSSKYYYVEFKLIEPLNADPLPLQFVNVWIPGVDEVPMSIAQYKGGENSISIIFKVVGEGTKALKDVEGFFGIKGPLGKGFDPRHYDKVLFIGGGVGIAPLPYLARYASQYGVVVDAAWGVRGSDMLFNLKEVANDVNEIYYATEDCGTGFCGTATQLAIKLVAENKARWDVVLAVGPGAMLRDLCRLLSSSVNVYVSPEAMVKCGLGACGSCVLKPHPKLLCVDGPVFECVEVIDYLEHVARN
ncbi:MAG: dihydroorotate dehydrogenase [Desulfurococcaceae archaeon]